MFGICVHVRTGKACRSLLHENTPSSCVLLLLSVVLLPTGWSFLFIHWGFSCHHYNSHLLTSQFHEFLISNKLFPHLPPVPQSHNHHQSPSIESIPLRNLSFKQIALWNTTICFFRFIYHNSLNSIPPIP